MSSQTDGLTHVTQYGYDTLDRLSLVTDALTWVTAYTYDGAGHRLTVAQPGTPSGTLTTTYG